MHPDHDVLALLALGEQAGSESERAHVRGCTHCTAEVSELAELVDLSRGVQPAPLEAPPSYVWDRISSELRLRTDRAAGSAVVPTGASISPADRRPHRRPVNRRLVAIAAVLALIVGIGAGIGIGRFRAGDQQSVVARANLAALPGWNGASGEATVQIDQRGRRELRITMTGPPVGDALVEAWLAKPDLSGMVALGQMNGDTGTFSLPTEIDLSQYSVVDVSKEPLDGNVAHSDDSIVRGPLT